MREIFENGQAPLFARNNAVLHIEPFLPDLVKTIFRSYCPNFSGDDLLALYASQAVLRNIFKISCR